MKTLSKLIPALILVAACSASLSAADLSEERARTATDLMTDQLQLSDEQAEQVYRLHKEMFADLSELQGEQRSNRLSQLRALRGLGKELDTSMQQVLDETQYQTWSEQAKQRREKMREYLSKQKTQ
ncbi:hypothetical protein DV711_17480 [Motiliproteus coralliicola]|uniref:Uncharacterized protein n=1 Tax=Motiliproteus coralliicola TaxID=2283196 RepID=A0A369WB97_9GAMM|nr:hypothetical protein [Motiliproteus coralliicola]RDE18439.1 hypothetical protein DV711_17480 [Motiliproteus coralliicola]